MVEAGFESGRRGVGREPSVVQVRIFHMRLISICLLLLLVSLLSVGLVSGTLVRHVVQTAPVVLAMTAVAAAYRWGAYSALAIFVFWFVIMFLIWLFLLGIAKVFSGTFTPVEVGLTVAIGLSTDEAVKRYLEGKREALGALE